MNRKIKSSNFFYILGVIMLCMFAWMMFFSPDRRFSNGIYGLFALYVSFIFFAIGIVLKEKPVQTNSTNSIQNKSTGKKIFIAVISVIGTLILSGFAIDFIGKIILYF